MVLEENTTTYWERRICNVTGFIVLRGQSTLEIHNSKCIAEGFILRDASKLIIESSDLESDIAAYDYSETVIINTSCGSSESVRIIRLNQAASVEIYDSTSLSLTIIGDQRSEISISSSGSNISIITGTEQCQIDIVNSTVSELHLLGWSEAHAQNTLFHTVTVNQGSIFVADSCAFSDLGCFDHRATVVLRECWASSLTDGLVYTNLNTSIQGDDIYLNDRSGTIEMTNSTIFDTNYVLYLLGIEGTYRLYNITDDVGWVLIDASNTTVELTDNEELTFYLQGGASLRIDNSRFSTAIVESAKLLSIDNCEFEGIDFSDAMIDELEIIDSRIISPSGPAIRGGWLTKAHLVDTQIITRASPSVFVNFINTAVLEGITDIELAGGYAVNLEIYDSTVNFTGVMIEHLHNNLGISELRFLDGATCSKLTTQPARLMVESLTLQKRYTRPGENVSVSAVVKNHGELRGAIALTLTLDEEPLQQYVVELAGLASKRIDCRVSAREIGVHRLRLGGEEASFTVSAGSDSTYLFVVLVLLTAVIGVYYLRRL